MTIAATRAHQPRPAPPTAAMVLAEVVGLDEPGLVQVRPGDPPAPVETARLAVLRYRPRVGDQVVLMRHRATHPLVIGVLASSEPEQLRTDDGTVAEIDDDAIVIRDHADTRVLSYSASAGLRLLAPEGDLTLAAPSGSVRIEAGADLDLVGTERVRLRTKAADVKAERLAIESTDTTLIAERLHATATDMSMVAGRWELRARRLVEATVDAYREVEGLAQVRAGRVRTLVEGAYQLLARRSEIVSEDDTIVDGKRVLLG